MPNDEESYQKFINAICANPEIQAEDVDDVLEEMIATEEDVLYERMREDQMLERYAEREC